MQESWVKKMRVNYSELEVTNDDESNVTDGGRCSIFEVIYELKKALINQPQFCERILLSLKPDFFLSLPKEKVEAAVLEFSILKVT